MDKKQEIQKYEVMLERMKGMSERIEQAMLQKSKSKLN